MGRIDRIDSNERPRWALRALRQMRRIFRRCPCIAGKSNCYGGEYGPCPYCACRTCNPLLPGAMVLVKAYDVGVEETGTFGVIAIRRAKAGELTLDVRENEVIAAGNDHTFQSVIVQRIIDREA